MNSRPANSSPANGNGPTKEKNVVTCTPPSQRKNAFTLLMSGKKSPSINRRKESDFVQCPSCNSSISFVNINIHLDKCIAGTNRTDSPAEDTKHVSSSKENLDLGHATKNTATRTLVSSSSKAVSGGNLSRKRRRPGGLETMQSDNETVGETDDTNNTQRETANQSSKKQTKTDAFNHMMQHSKKVYDRETKKIEKQRFHLSLLDGKFHLQWLCGDDFDKFNTAESDVRWSGAVILHASKEEKAASGGNRKDVELHITSSIASDPPFTRALFVQTPSKFSVPVLKSMLQKSIRRRRPLPSVRLAMELADKSYVDLIRRVPIICLEDSFLHHDFPLLCWLMVADSKDFVAPPPLIEKLMKIIFEIASCPWKDMYDDGKSKDTNASYSLDASSGKDLFHSADLELCDLMLRSMILRKKYGGMACDKRMIDNFVSLWSGRYQRSKVDKDIVTKCFPNSTEVPWKDVPFLLHASENSTNMLQQLLSAQLPSLKMHDICPAGIDFHCSNVIEFLVKDTTSPLVTKLCNYLRSESKESITNTVRTMMWDYSAGVNHRRSFTSKDEDRCNPSKAGDSVLKQIWQEEIVPRLKEFTTAYITARLRVVYT